MLSTDEILAIPVDAPHKLFTNREDLIGVYRRLAARYHPDRGGSSELFAHINVLYEAAQKLLKEHDWPGSHTFTSTSGVESELTYLLKRPFELGTVYISRALITFEVAEEYTDLVANAKRILELRSTRSTDLRKSVVAAMVDDLLLRVPRCVHFFETQEKASVLVLEKDPQMLCLRDVVTYFGGKIPPKHAAWIISRLYDLGCLLAVGMKVAHGDISTDSVFIDPAQHSISLLGGWWYAQQLGAKLPALPARSTAQGALQRGVKPVASQHVTQALIRATAREILGDINGSALLVDKSIPREMTTWLRQVVSDKAVDEYKTWGNNVVTSLGPRKFVKMNVTEKDLYA